MVCRFDFEFYVQVWGQDRVATKAKYPTLKRVATEPARTGEAWMTERASQFHVHKS